MWARCGHGFREASGDPFSRADLPNRHPYCGWRPERASSPGEVYGHRTIRPQANVRLGADYGRTRTGLRAPSQSVPPSEHFLPRAELNFECNDITHQQDRSLMARHVIPLFRDPRAKRPERNGDVPGVAAARRRRALSASVVDTRSVSPSPAPPRRSPSRCARALW